MGPPSALITFLKRFGMDLPIRVISSPATHPAPAPILLQPWPKVGINLVGHAGRPRRQFEQRDVAARARLVTRMRKFRSVLLDFYFTTTCIGNTEKPGGPLTATAPWPPCAAPVASLEAPLGHPAVRYHRVDTDFGPGV